MEIEKLSDFLQNCCRVCLAIENEMVDSANIVENFNKTIDQLLFECADMKMLSEAKDCPKLVCEECTGELIMVAKFREKCQMSTTALNELNKQLGQKSKTINLNLISTHNSLIIEDPGTEVLLDTDTENIKNENIEYDDENVEYVIFDSSQDLIEENEVIDKIDEQSIASEENVMASEERQRENHSSKPPRKIAKRKSNVVTRKKVKSAQTDFNRCNVCGAGFAQLKNLTRHLQTHSDADINELNRFACTTCDELFTDLNDWMVHQKKHGSNDDKNELEIQSLVDESISKRHVCQFCGKNFPSISLLTTHVRIHTNERPFICEKAECNKAFKTRGGLDLHLRRHAGIKPYKCWCGACFVESSNLKVHMRTHTGHKPHECLTCNRKFSRVFLLQIHQRTHTGEKPFACDCGKSFAQQGDLAAHKRIHSGERPHKCKLCSKAFIKKSALTQHMKRHEKPASTSSTVWASKRPKINQAAANEENIQIEIINLNAL